MKIRSQIYLDAQRLRTSEKGAANVARVLGPSGPGREEVDCRVAAGERYNRDQFDGSEEKDFAGAA